MNISIEIVPRDPNYIERELKTVQSTFKSVNTINIPDLLRFPTRSWHGSRIAKGYYNRVIPHLRAIDFNLKAPLPLIDELVQADIQEVLVVSGDPPKTIRHVVYPNKSTDLIKLLKRELPHLKVYAAIDPYRQNFQDEHRYAMQKLDAGAEGVFTQPFFDTRLMQIYAELLDDVEIYWGVSPVLTEKSKAYWETVNKAIFPKHFDLSLDWNRTFAQDALDFARAYDHHIYYMPIRVNLERYLGGIL